MILKRDEVTGGWRMLHGEDMIASTHSMNGAEDSAYRILVRKPEGKRPLG
jgi:hypothetical protein